MPNQNQLHELECQLFWCRDWYLLRLWQHCGSPEAATAVDRIEIARELLDDSNGRTKEWASQGRTKLVDHLVEKLDHADPLLRQEAAKEIADCCPKDHAAVNVLIERIRSPDQTFHDRTCAVWALGRIGVKAGEVIPILVGLIEENKDQAEADEFRRFAAKAIEKLRGEF
jgi:hypothetical protein